jgi:hypothetical protein
VPAKVRGKACIASVPATVRGTESARSKDRIGMNAVVSIRTRLYWSELIPAFIGYPNVFAK